MRMTMLPGVGDFWPATLGGGGTNLHASYGRPRIAVMKSVSMSTSMSLASSDGLVTPSFS